MRAKKTRQATYLLGLAFLSNSSVAQHPFDAITQLITDSIEVIGQARQNAAFIIVRGDSIIYEHYWGTWNSNTYQPIASGSKLLSMALIARLFDEGYLSPQDVVQDYLPSFSGKPTMTLHQLMSHTSGLPGQSPFISDSTLTLGQAVDSIGLKTPMTAYAPGTAFQYGGVSMHVAGRMAEVATGMRWDSLFQQKIASPLNLQNTDYSGLGSTLNFRIAGGVGTTMRDFAQVLRMLLKYGKHGDMQVIDSLTVVMMQSDQTGGVPLVNTPYANDPLRRSFRYGYGVWIEERLNGHTTQLGSQGAFGFTPWIDRCRDIVCVLFVRRTLGAVQPTHTRLRALVEQIIPLKLERPIIALVGNQLRSSYSQGNQWYLDGEKLLGETNQYLSPIRSGIYSVRYVSEEGCEVFSNPFHYAVSLTEEPSKTGTLFIYPNPARTHVYVDGVDDFQVWTPTGVLVERSRPEEGQLSLAGWPTGLYFVLSGNRVGRFLKVE